jgi:hypothetical protein
LGAHPEPALPSGEAGGDTEQPALGLRLCAGWVAVEEQPLVPGKQIDGEHDHAQPGLVDAEGTGRDVVQAGILAGADAVLDPSTLWGSKTRSGGLSCDFV